MSLHDNPSQDNNRPVHHSAPESLGQVLNSLQHILEHKRFLPAGEADATGPVSEPVVETFSGQPAELYDDPLYPDNGDIPLLTSEEVVDDDIHIPVLNDIIFKGLADAPGQGPEIEAQLTQLRQELEAIVSDIMGEARQQLESGNSVPAENSLQHFLRELGQQRPD